MVHRMVADNMPLLCHSHDKLGLTLDIRTRNKKCSGNAFFLKRVENQRGIAVFVPLVKGQIERLFLFASHINAVILIHHLGLLRRKFGAAVRSAEAPAA